MNEYKSFIIYTKSSPPQKFNQFEGFPHLYGYVGGQNEKITIEGYRSLQSENIEQFYFPLKDRESNEELQNQIKVYFLLINEKELFHYIVPLVKAICLFVTDSDSFPIENIINHLTKNTTEILDELIKYKGIITPQRKNELFLQIIRVNFKKEKDQDTPDFFYDLIKKEKNDKSQYLNFLTEGILLSEHCKKYIGSLSLDLFNKKNFLNLIKLYLYSPDLFAFPPETGKEDIALSKEEGRDYHLCSTISQICEGNAPYEMFHFDTLLISRRPFSQVIQLYKKYQNSKDTILSSIKEYLAILNDYSQLKGNFIVYTKESQSCQSYFDKSRDRDTQMKRMTKEEVEAYNWVEYFCHPPENIFIYIESDVRTTLSLLLPFNQLCLPSHSIEFAKLFYFEEKSRSMKIKVSEEIYEVIKPIKTEKYYRSYLDKSDFKEFVILFLTKEEKRVFDLIETGNTDDGLSEKVFEYFLQILLQIVQFFDFYYIKESFISKANELWNALASDLVNHTISIDLSSKEESKENQCLSKNENNILEIQFDFLSNALSELIPTLKNFESNVNQLDDDENSLQEELETVKKAFKVIPLPALIKTVDEKQFEHAIIEDYVKKNFPNKTNSKEIISLISSRQMDEIKKCDIQVPLYYYYVWINSKKEIFDLLINMSYYSDINLLSFSNEDIISSDQSAHNLTSKSIRLVNKHLIENSINQIKDKNCTSLKLKQQWINLMFLYNEAQRLQNKTWLFTKEVLHLKNLLSFRKHSQEATITSLLLENASAFNLFDSLQKLDQGEVVMDILCETYKTYRDEGIRLLIINEILSHYDYLRHAGRFFEMSLKRFLYFNFEEEDHFFPKECSCVLMDSIEKVLQNKDESNATIRECLEQILLYYFDCVFLTFLPLKSRDHNVESDKAIAFFEKAINMLELLVNQSCTEDYRNILQLYCVSYCKIFLSNFALVLKDLNDEENTNYGRYEKYHAINIILKKTDTKMRDMVKLYILKTLRKNLTSYSEFESFSFISKEMLFVQNYKIKEEYPSNFDFLFYSEEKSLQYEAMHYSFSQLRKEIFRTRAYNQEIQKEMLSNIDLFLDVTFNCILSNLFQKEYCVKQEYVEFSMWVKNIIDTLPYEKSTLKNTLSRIYYQEELEKLFKNKITLEELEIMFIAFKLTVCLVNENEKIRNLLITKINEKSNQPIDLYDEIQDYYLYNPTESKGTYVVITDNNGWKVVNAFNCNNSTANAVFLNEEHKESIEKGFEISLSQPIIIDKVKRPLFHGIDNHLMSASYSHHFDNNTTQLFTDLQVKFSNFILFSFSMYTESNKKNLLSKLFELWKAFLASLHSFSIDEPKIFFNYIFESFKKEVSQLGREGEEIDFIAFLNKFIHRNIIEYQNNKDSILKAIFTKKIFNPLSMKSILQELYKNYHDYEKTYLPNDYPLWKLFFYVTYPNLDDFQKKLGQIYNYKKKYPFICMFIDTKKYSFDNVKKRIEKMRYCCYLDKTRISRGIVTNAFECNYEGYYGDIENIVKAFSYRDIFGKNGIDYGNSASIVYQFDLIEKELEIFNSPINEKD